MAHAQKPDLVFQRNGWVHLNRRGCQFSRLLAVEECGSADSDCIDRVPTYSARLLATHSIRIFPLHFPFRASPCANRFRTRYNILQSEFNYVSKPLDYASILKTYKEVWKEVSWTIEISETLLGSYKEIKHPFRTLNIVTALQHEP